MTTLFDASRSLEHGIFTIADEGIPEELPDFDPSQEAVHIFESTLVVAAVHEIDGDARITVLLNEASEEHPETPHLKGSGRIKIHSGSTALYTSAWADLDYLDLPPGDYRASIFSSGEEYPLAVAVIFDRL